MGRKASTAIFSLKVAGLIIIVDLGVAGIAWEAYAVGFVATLGLAMLVESAALMLLGGALSFSGQGSVRKLVSLVSRTETNITRAELEDLDAKAAGYALIGVMLFFGSMALAVATL